MGRKGSVWIAVGLLMIAAALVLTIWNLEQSRLAGDSAVTVAEDLRQRIPDAPQKDEGYQQNTADSIFPAETYPDYVLHPDMEMPVQTLDGNDYIGVIAIPSLELELPVMSQWSYDKLQIAPCRYQGSAYWNDLILMAHNYGTHFGKLRNLHFSDAVVFTDVDGNVFSYEVVELETLQPTDIEKMESGDWDLTLFTCTVGGQSRITVRCVLTSD